MKSIEALWAMKDLQLYAVAVVSDPSLPRGVVEIRTPVEKPWRPGEKPAGSK